MPLDINLVAHGHAFDREYGSVLQEFAPRIRCLQISMASYDSIEGVSRMIGSSFLDSLECLKICRTRLMEGNETSLPDSRDKVLISGDGVSRIKALALDAMSLLPFIPANRFPDLTHVHIRWNYIHIADMLLLLSNAARIEYLSFKHVHSVILNSQPPSGGPLIMPSLKTVTFYDSDLPSSSTILSYIALTHSQALVRFSQAQEMVYQLPQTADPLASLLEKANISMHNATHLEVDITFSFSRFILAESLSHGFWLEDEPQHQWMQVSDLLCLRNIISFSTITSLVLIVTHEALDSSQAFFQAFPSLKSLCLHLSVDQFDIQESPKSDKSLIHSLASSPTACPKLVSLSIIYDLNDGDIKYLEEVCTETAKRLVTELSYLVKIRETAGVPLRRIAVQLDYRNYLDERVATMLEALQKLLMPLSSLVEEFMLVGPGESLRPRRVHNWLPDNTYWDIGAY